MRTSVTCSLRVRIFGIPETDRSPADLSRRRRAIEKDRQSQQQPQYPQFAHVWRHFNTAPRRIRCTECEEQDEALGCICNGGSDLLRWYFLSSLVFPHRRQSGGHLFFLPVAERTFLFRTEDDGAEEWEKKKRFVFLLCRRYFHPPCLLFAVWARTKLRANYVFCARLRSLTFRISTYQCNL